MGLFERSNAQKVASTSDLADANRLLAPAEVALMIGLSAASLARYRCWGKGPKYQKLGPEKNARVRYRLADVNAWLQQGAIDEQSQGSFVS